MTASQIRIAVASSGLGHVARGIEAWADDLAAALHARGESVTLYKGGGVADRSYERVVACLQREAPRTARLLRVLPRRVSWRVGLGSPYSIEQTSFALRLVGRLIRDGETGFRVPQDDAAAIGRRLVELATNRGLLERLSASAAAFARTYHPDRVLDLLEHELAVTSAPARRSDTKGVGCDFN